MLNIHVCIKQSVDVNSLEFDPTTLSPMIEKAEFRIGDAELNAIEEAVRIKEKMDGKVSLLCVGHDVRPAVLREALAMGADEAYVVSDSRLRNADQWVYANILAYLSRVAGIPDLILCGESSLDEGAYQVGPRIAEELDLPSVTHAVKLEIMGDYIIAERIVEDGIETLKAKLPAVVSVCLEINTPRLPSVLMIRAASKKPINFIPLDSINLPRERFRSLVKLQEVKVIKTKRKNVVLSGSLEEIARKVITIIQSEGRE
ncbi:MAG: electron transfer flavoprotein subunit beta/FixA family protein [Nitrososphaerota archaeon]